VVASFKTAVIYCDILNLENVSTVVNYCDIFIKLHQAVGKKTVKIEGTAEVI